MEEFLKKSLNFKTVKGTNQFGFGGISQGQTFVVDDNRKIFVKQNSDSVVSYKYTFLEFLAREA